MNMVAIANDFEIELSAETSMDEVTSPRARVGAARANLAERHEAKPVSRFQGRMARLANVRRRDHSQVAGWCILRTSGRHTIALAQSLAAAGIEAWTPSEVRRRRLPRGRKGYRETEEAIVPSFVFARADHLDDILRALAAPISPHPRFSLFQHAGRAPVVGDKEIANLRAVEDKSRIASRKTRKHVVNVGEAVRPDEGAFAGLDGVVESVLGNTATVCFNGSFRVKIATWLLVDDDVKPRPETSRQDRQRVASAA